MVPLISNVAQLVVDKIQEMDAVQIHGKREDLLPDSQEIKVQVNNRTGRKKAV